MHSKSPLGSKQGHSGQDPGAPAPQSSVARISCSSVRFFIMFNLLCQSAFQRAVVTRVFTSANFLTLETAVIPATVIAVKMCAHQDPAFFLFIVRRLHFLVPASFTRYPTHFGNRGVLATPAVAVGAAHPRHTFSIRLCFRKLLKKVLRIGFTRVLSAPFM